jgi:uncharacterized protein (DUF1800 family)
MSLSLSAEDAWTPLPASAWDEPAARHLLRRAGWTARAADVKRALGEGLPGTLDRLFPSPPVDWPMPDSVAGLERDLPDYHRQVAQATGEEKRKLQREAFERSQAAVRDMSVNWMELAAIPDNSAFEKWVSFLGNVFVIATEKVHNAAFVYRHFEILAGGALGTAPKLAKAVSRSPAMEVYLDLAENRTGAPNENFARELFELFLLGEGNYTEADIKEAARAFTGYRIRPATGAFAFARRQHDDGIKTVFGQSGRFGGDDIIDLAYGRRAAGVHLPRRMSAFYLGEVPPPPEYLFAIGDKWRGEGGYDLRWLVRSFFGSRIFFAPEFRGNLIKSPVQLYLGLLQDLDLDVMPVPRFVVNPLRQMGETPFNPPNVRGWVGGRAWINSASLGARRSLVERLFAPPDGAVLTADEQQDVAAARARGESRFSVAESDLDPWMTLSPDKVMDVLQERFLAAQPGPDFRSQLLQFLAGHPADPAEHRRRLRRGIMTALESPEYQVC